MVILSNKMTYLVKWITSQYNYQKLLKTVQECKSRKTTWNFYKRDATAYKEPFIVTKQEDTKDNEILKIRRG